MKPGNPNEENKKLEVELVKTSEKADDTSTSSVSENEKDLIPLSAEAFIKAMQGETVIDENGVERCFVSGNEFGNKIVEIKEVILEEEIAVFENLEFNYSIRILSGVFTKEFVINGGKFLESFSIYGGKFNDDFSIEGGSFASLMNVNGGKFLKKITIKGGLFSNMVHVTDGNFKEGFSISGGEFSSWVIFKCKKKSKELLITGGEFKNRLIVFSNSFNMLYISNGIPDNLVSSFFKGRGFIDILELNLFKNCSILINSNSNSNVNKINIEGEICLNSSIKIKDLSLNFLNVENVNNKGDFELTDINFTSKVVYEIKKRDDVVHGYTSKVKLRKSLIRFKNCKLGQASFHAVHFNQVKQIAIDNSDFSEASIRVEYLPYKLKKQIYSNFKIDWINKTIVEGSESLETHRLADFYNDLANMMKRQGNKRMELNYIATYKQLLRQSLNPFYDFTDWLPLALGKISNNNGTNWWQAFLFTFIAPLLFFVPYVLWVNAFDFCINCPFWESLRLGTQNYLDFAVPNFFKMTFNEPTFGALLMSIFGKIVFAYGVYQFIQAFRRLGRR